jgi:hypothetical protein
VSSLHFVNTAAGATVDITDNQLAGVTDSD